jgi:fucose permease
MTAVAPQPGRSFGPEAAPSGTDGAAPRAVDGLRLRRDRTTGFCYAALCAWGWFLYSFGVVVPLLRDEQGTSRAVAALHSTASAGGCVVAGLVAAALVRRFNRRVASTAAAAVTAAGTCALLLGSPTGLTLGSAFVVGFGGSLLANVAIAAIMAHQGAAGTAALSEGNGLAACVALVAPLAVGVSVGLGWGWQPALALYLPLLALTLWVLWTVPRGVPTLDGEPRLGADPGAARARARLRLPSAFWPYVVVIMCSVGIEFITATWSGDLLVERTGVSAAQGTAMVSTVIAGMAVGRFLLGRLALQHPEVPMLLGAFGLTFTGWLVVWTSTNVAVSFVGLALTGLGIAGQFPLAMTLCVRAAPGLSDRAVGVSGSAIGVAIGLGPFALGALADATDIHTAFVVVPVLIAVAATVLLLVRSRTTAMDQAA